MPHRYSLLHALLIAITVSVLPAQEMRSANRLTTEQYLDWERISDAQISPDGARIIYTRQHANKLEDKWESDLWIMNADGSLHRFLAKGSNPRWSNDGRRILYLAEGEPKSSQIFVRWIDVDGPATQITHVNDKLAGVRWSPDGKLVAFTMFVPEKNKWTISMPEEPKGAKWTPAPRIVETLHYRQDQVGFLEDGFTHLFVVPAEGGTPRQLTSGKWNVGAGELRGNPGFDWTPDSASIVFDANRDTDWELKYQISKLSVIHVATGGIRDLVTRQGSWGRPAVSPDGRTVAFTGYPTSGRTHTVSDLYVVPLAGGEMRKINPGLDRDPLNLRWATDGSGVYFDADDHGSRNVHLATLAGSVSRVTSGIHVLTFDSVSRDLIAAGTEADPDHPQDVVRYDLRKSGQIVKLTSVNEDVLAGIKIGKTEELNLRRTVAPEYRAGWSGLPISTPRRNIR